MLYFLLLFFFILNPYFLLNGVIVQGGMVAALAFFAFNSKNATALLYKASANFYSLTLALFAIASLFSIFLNALYDTEFTFIVLIVRTYLYFFIGLLIGVKLIRKRETEASAILWATKIALFATATNSAIIIFGFIFPDFKGFTESLLADATNIDYKNHDFRLRGLASGGGASLSVLNGTMIAITCYLYLLGQLKASTALMLALTLFVGMLFIGRTGIVMAFFGTLLSIAMAEKNRCASVKVQTLYLFFFTILLAAVLPIFLNLFVSEKILEYSLLFFYDGLQGIEKEGTAAVVMGFYSWPESVLHTVIGAGNMSGHFSEGVSTDAGYMKTMTALGVPLTVIFYLVCSSFIIILSTGTKARSIILITLMIILVSELKEPFLLQGYTARFLWVMIGIAAAYNPSKWRFFRTSQKS